MYKGPDKKYLGRDVCYSYNEDTLTIYDVTDPKNSSIISVTSYEGATYTHQVGPRHFTVRAIMYKANIERDRAGSLIRSGKST